jgi:adenosylhomocysteine nucleosidase
LSDPPIGVVAALRAEVRRLNHPRLRLVVGGVGYDRARAAAARLCDAARPTLLVSAGFCGALDPALRTGDLLVGGTVREARRFAPDERALGALPDARRGDTLWVPQVRRDLGARPEGVAAVDMESAAVAAVALERGIPFVSIRAVLDTPDAPLASDYRWTTLLKFWAWPGAARDARRAGIASARLVEGLTLLAERFGR